MSNKYVEYSRHFPPRCIRALNPVSVADVPPEVRLHDAMLYFRVSCPCGEKVVHLLGYNYHDAAYPKDDVFLGPLAIECPKCSRISELMNPEIHGYDGEQDGSCTRTGEGERIRYETPCCGQTKLELLPGFSYNMEDFDEDFAGREEAQRPQDFFDWFQLCGRCSSCGAWHAITDFECA